MHGAVPPPQFFWETSPQSSPKPPPMAPNPLLFLSFILRQRYSCSIIIDFQEPIHVAYMYDVTGAVPP